MKTKKSILVCEDDPGIRNTLYHLLQAEGYTVFLTEHGREGIDLLRRMEPPCVVLLDIQMPEMDGYEFLREKNSDHAIASIPVVVVSATADASRLIGVSGIIKKPFVIDDLLATVGKFCGDKC